MSFYGYLVDLHTNQVLIIISFLILTVVEDRNFKILAYVQTLDHPLKQNWPRLDVIRIGMGLYLIIFLYTKGQYIVYIFNWTECLRTVFNFPAPPLCVIEPTTSKKKAFNA